MRFIYVLLIGMIVFNGVLFLFSGDFDSDGVSDFFPMGTYGEHATNVTNPDETISSYKSISELGFVTAVTTGAGIFIVFTVAGSVFAKQQVAVYIGVGMFIGLYTSLSIIVTDLFSTILRYPIVSQLYIIITIGIGVLATITIIEMFTGGGGGN